MGRASQQRIDDTSGLLGSWSGYALTAMGGQSGGFLGGAVGFLLVRGLGDPSLGMANIPLMLAAGALIVFLAVAGIAAGAYFALRSGREGAAGLTVVGLLLTVMPLVWWLSGGYFQVLAVVLMASLLSRLLAVRASKGTAIERVGVVGVIGLIWLVAVGGG